MTEVKRSALEFVRRQNATEVKRSKVLNNGADNIKLTFRVLLANLKLALRIKHEQTLVAKQKRSRKFSILFESTIQKTIPVIKLLVYF